MSLLRKLLVRDTANEPCQRRIRLLVVEEDGRTLSIIGRRLTQMGYDVVLAEGGATGIALMMQQRFDFVLIDAGMARLSGIATLRKMHASGMMGDTSTMMIVGRNDAAAMVEALDAGADDTIVKPFDFDVLDVRIRHIVTRARRVADLKHQNHQLDARVARRAVELGEARIQLQQLAADRETASGPSNATDPFNRA